MNDYIIREIQDNELERSAAVITQSFETVANDFGLTKENCSTHGAFIKTERLIADKSRDVKMFGLFVEGEQAGFVAIARQSESIYEMEKLAVLPRYRRHGYGKALMDFAREYIKFQNGEKVTIGIINENMILKQWYSAYGFLEKGTKIFSHLPFTVCFMELTLTANARAIRYEELPQLLSLYKQLHPDDPDVYGSECLYQLWDEIYNDPNLHYIVIEEDGELVAACNISIIKNLTRGLRPYGLIENVVTHKDYRKRGYGTKVLHRALEIAKENNCYKVMLMTGSKSEDTLRFYEKAGFSKGVKTGFIVNL